VPEYVPYRAPSKCTEQQSLRAHNCTRSARLCMEAVSLHSGGQLHLFVAILLHSGPTAQIMQHLQWEGCGRN